MFINKNARKKISKEKKNSIILFVCLTIIPLTQFLIFWVGVRINSFLLAFQTYDPIQTKYVFSGLDTFKQVFNDIAHLKNYKDGFLMGLRIWGLTIVTNVPLCVFFSYIFHKKLPGDKFFIVLNFIPTILSSMVTVTLYKYFCENAIPGLLQTITGKEFQGLISNPKTAFLTLFVYQFWCGFGGTMLMYLGQMKMVPQEVLDAGMIDGVTFIEEFFHIVFPYIYPLFSLQYALCVEGIFNATLPLFPMFEINAPMELQSLGYYLYVQTFIQGDVVYPQLTAIGLMIAAICIPATICLMKVREKLDPMKD